MKKNVPTNYLINWIGGKRLLRQRISELIPQNIESYIEPFGGGAWVLFYKENWAKLEVYNDLDDSLVNLFTIVKYHPEELIKEFKWMFGSRRMFYRAKNWTTFTDIQRAAKFLFLLTRSFGGKREHFGTAIRGTTSYKSHENIMLRIEAISKRLDKVVIENFDFEELINKYDYEEAFFYLDPPYTEGVGYATTSTKDFEHKKLCECLKKLKGRFLLSYNDSPMVRELYKDFNIIETSRQNGINNCGSGRIYKELLISNYEGGNS